MGVPKIKSTTPEYIKYSTNIDNFVASLPKSEFRVLYFIKDKGQYVPRLNTIAGKWKTTVVPNETLYVVEGLESGFCYIYRETQIKYNVVLDDNKVVAFDNKNYAPFPGGGKITTVDETNWGDHLTVEVQTSFANRNLLVYCTHVTNYIEDNKPGTYFPSRLGCVTHVTDTINSTTQCLHNSIPDGSTMDKYRLITNEDTILKIITKMHDIMMGKSSGGRKKTEYITHNGKKYVLHKGKKGGTYIKVNDSKKYISRNTSQQIKSGGSSKFNESGTFSDSFIEFMQLYVLNGINDDNLTDVFVWFDGGSTLMIRYTFDVETDGIENVKSTVFGVLTQHLSQALDIFSIPEPERTPEQQNNINLFNQTFVIPVYVY